MAYELIVFPFKDPNEVLDYVVDWSDRLGVDTVATSTWFLDAGNDDAVLAIDSDTNDDTTATVWLSAGTEGVRYRVTNRITTAGGRTMDQSCDVLIRSK